MASSLNANVSPSVYCQACGAAHQPQAKQCAACGEPLLTARGASGATTNPLTGLLLPDVLIHQRYRILEVVSKDQISTVYKAQDTQFGKRVVALKEINQQSTQEATELVEEGRREMLLLAGLIHPNLPRIYDYFVENQRWYFVRDFLAGETLEAYLKKRKDRPLPVEEVIDIGIQLATVLDYLHVHQSPLGLKDLTLSGIWRTPDGKLYLLDTGTAPAVSAMLQSSSVYSLGVILRQLEAGKSSLRARLHAALPRLRKGFRHVQALPLEGLIRQMVHRNAGKRPSTMGMVRQELQEQELQLLARQRTPTSTPKQRRFPRRTVLKLGGFAVASSALTWLVESSISSLLGGPNPSYSPNLGGTICTYNSGSGVLGVAWSPNGMRLAMGNWKGQVQAFDANSGGHAIDFQAPGLQQRIEDLIWLPGGKAIAAGGDDGIVWVWNAASRQLQCTYRGHSGWVITLASSPDGRYIASGSEDMTVHVWEAASGRQVVVYSGHASGIGSVAWSPDGKYIASGSYDMTVQIWEAVTGLPVYTYSEYKNQVYTVAWSPDGNYIASGGKDHTVQVWPVALVESNGQLPKSSIITYRGHSASVQDVAWSPDSRYVASAAENVQLWNALSGKQVYTYTKHTTSVTSQVQAVAWSPNGKYIASGGMEGTVQVWNA